MASIQDLLGKFNLGMDDLNGAERATLMEWLGKLKSRQLTLSDIQTHISGLISALERELSGLDTPTNLVAWMFRGKRETYLKARLKNYLMLQDFLLGPERAQKWIESQLEGIKPN